MFRAQVPLTSLLLISASALFAEGSPEFEKSAVVLRYSGNVILNHDDARTLFNKSVEILQSSNFNSSTPRWQWDEAKIGLEHGRSVSGKHVLITFNEPERIETVGGYVSARELVIGLNGAEVASPVHTVDADGKVVGHSKYLGQLCIELMNLVKEIAVNSPNKAMGPTR
jgi:hypothetical protein